MSQYSERIRQWAMDTRRAGVLPDADGVGEVGLDAGEAGRRLAVRFMLRIERDRVAEARYQVFGCGFSMAACAAAADMAIGCRLHTLEEIDAVTLDQALAGLPEERRYCADLAIEALHAAARSALNGRTPVAASVREDPEHGPRVTPQHPLYRLLMGSRQPKAVGEEDRHLFACLLSVAADEPYDMAAALGLEEHDLAFILTLLFPGVHRSKLERFNLAATETPPDCHGEVLEVLYEHLPAERGGRLLVASWLASILATRATLPGHLWVAMGLTERPQLTAAIRRHLPTLAAANRENMRWKRFLYKQVCARNGGMMCKAPNCGVCSDYRLCFAEE